MRNEGDKQGYWSILSKRTPIYAKATLSPQERWRAARFSRDRVGAAQGRLGKAADVRERHLVVLMRKP